MPKEILTDTCFWLGLLSENDQHYTEAISLKVEINECTIVFPFPCMYEIVRTKFVKDKIKLASFENYLKSLKVKFIDDSLYKDAALKKVYEQNRQSNITYSLADIVIREMILDINLRIHYFITFNEKDFADVCARRGIEILRQNIKNKKRIL